MRHGSGHFSARGDFHRVDSAQKRAISRAVVRRLWIAWAVAGAIAISLLWPLHGAILSWDEVGYVRAARLGFSAHYQETGTLSYPDFAKFVDAKRKGQPPELPPDYDEEKSPI